MSNVQPPRERHAFDFDVCSKCEGVYRRPTPEVKALSAITAEMRIVYRTPGGRTFLTRLGAYNQYAWWKIRQKYPCRGLCGPASPYDGEPSGGCDKEYPDGEEAVVRLHARFVRWLRWHDAELRRTGVRRAS